MLASQFPEVMTTRLSDNVGFGRAVNHGVGLADGEIVVVINDDVTCGPEAVRALSSAFDAPEVGMAGGVLIQAGSDLVDSAGLLCDSSLGSVDWGRGEHVAAFQACVEQGGAVPAGPTGGFAAYRRNAFEQVGGFDPAFFAYYEDLDLALRLRARGWGFEPVPGACAIHLGSATSGWRSIQKAAMVGRSRGLMVRKYGVLSRPRAWPILAIEFAAGLVLCIELRTLSPLGSRAAGFAGGARTAPYPKNPAVISVGVSEVIRARISRRYQAAAAPEAR
jgi:GT2 family glycosyltransferase